jgi:hypothetical protein
MSWPPVITVPAWVEEGNLVFDQTTQTITASGELNFSSTGSLSYLTLQGYNGNTSWVGVNVTTKASGNADTYQLEGSYDAVNWFNVDNPFSVTQGLVTANNAQKMWNRGQLAGATYFRIAATLDAGTVQTTVQTGYQLDPN